MGWEPTPSTESALKELDQLPDSVGFPPTVAMINSSDDDEEIELGFWGDAYNHCWIGRPRTPPVQLERNTARFIRQPNVFPITFQELSSNDRAYMAQFAASREPRPVWSEDESSPRRTRDGSNQEGSGSPEDQTNSDGDKPLDPPASPEHREEDKEEPPEIEEGSGPRSPKHKYEDEEIDFSSLEAIQGERSTARRVSDHFQVAINETGGEEAGAERQTTQYRLVERSCHCHSPINDWESGSLFSTEYANGTEPSDLRPFEERWEEEDLIRSLLCSEELTTSREAENSDGNDPDGADSSFTGPSTI